MTGVDRLFVCPRVAVVIAACGVWLCPVSSSYPQSIRAAGADDGERTAPANIYRRIFVPADNVDAWPRDGEKYLPIEAHDFDRWIEAANRDAGDQVSHASITEAEYWARLEGDQLVEGRGRWTIAVRGDGGAFLPLGEMSLVVKNPRWRGAAQQLARFGAWGHSGAFANNVGLDVPQPGILEFDWHVQPAAGRDAIEIPWRLPAATSTRVILDLPAGKQPEIEGGVVLATQPAPPDTKRADSNRRRWQLAVDPSLGTVLRITAGDGATTDEEPGHAMREDVSYRITQRGLEIETTWQFADLLNGRRELTLPLPPGVHIMSASSKGQELAWRIVKNGDADAGIVRIELPEIPARRSLRVRLTAWHPLMLGQVWRLPKLRPDGVFWTSGTIQLAVADQLELRDLSYEDCVETGVSEAHGAETRFLAAYAPTAELEVAVAQRQVAAAVRVGSSLAMADRDISGRLITQWTISQGSVHRFSGELAPGWVIEAVETNPAEALDEWYIDRRDGRDQLKIQLARPASVEQGISLMITARLQQLGTRTPISAATLRMIEWRGARVDRHLLTFQPVEPYAVEAVGRLPVVAGEAIGNEDQELITRAAGGETVYDLALADEDAGLQLSPKRGQYEAEIWLDATYSRGQLRQTHHVVIRPTTNRVDRLLIFSTSSLGDQVHWTEGKSNARIAAERLLPDDPRRAGLPAGGELWLLRLPRPTSQWIELTATLTTPWPSRLQAPLVALPEAVEQRGRVFVRGDMVGMPLLEQQGMRSIAVPAPLDGVPETNDEAPVRVAYRFDPADCLATARTPVLWMAPPEVGGPSPLVARRVELESFFYSDGRATHRATYHLENDGASQFDFRFPTAGVAVLNSVWVDGRAVEQPLANASEELSPIRLPASAPTATVSVYFETEQAALSAGSELVPPLIRNDVPVLAGEWTIWLPDEFSTAGANPTSGENGIHWRERLFGPLARPEGARPFHPLRAADWHRLAGNAGSWLEPAEAGTSAIAHTTLPGWQAHRAKFIAEHPAPVVVAHPPATTAWSVAAFLLSLAGGYWLRERRRELYVAALGTAAGFSLLLPAVFAPLATGVFLGLLSSLLTPRLGKKDLEDESPLSWSRLSTAGIVSVALAVGVPNLAAAQPLEADAPTNDALDPARIHRVLIPADAEGRPTGKKYYVSERFLRELLQSTQGNTDLGGQWLLRDAVYQGKLRERAEPPGVVAGEWSLTFTIDVLARDTTVVLPLVRSEAIWQNTAMLDGVPTPLVWKDDGRGCAVGVREPGRYSLRLSCVPRTNESAGQNLLKLTIPPLRGARVQLDYPQTTTWLLIDGVEVPRRDRDSPGVIKRELHGANQLEVQWPTALPADGAEGLRVTGMRWLRIGADEVELETKYVMDGSARRPDALVVAFDRRWELMRKNNAPADWRVEDGPDARRTVRVPVPPNDTARQEVTLRWRLADGLSLGRLLLPRIELISVPVTQRWLAVTSDPALECEIVGAAGSPGLINEFLAMWGELTTTGAPQLVLENIPADIALGVTVRPRQAESKIDETLHVATGSDELRVLYQADVIPDNARAYQFSLVVPPDLSIEQIAVTQAGRNIPLRWARSAENRVNVFFGEEVDGEYRLELAGTAALADSRSRALPRVAAIAPAAAAQHIQLYREEEVLVEVQGLSAADKNRSQNRPQTGGQAHFAPKTPQNEPVPGGSGIGSQSPSVPFEPTPAQWDARPVAAYRLDKAAAESVRLIATANDVSITGPVLTIMTRQSDAWWVGFHGRFTVERGQLDSLRLRVPPSWAGPFTVESDVAAAVTTTVRDQEQAMVSIRFDRSIEPGHAVSLAIRSPLTLTAPSLISVPEIMPDPLPKGRRYLLVPATVEKRPVEWTQVGVREAELPRDLQAAGGAPIAEKSMEIIASPFRVAIQPPAVMQPSAHVRLADTTVASGVNGGLLIATRFAISPNDLAECTLNLPGDQELLAANLDGGPAVVRRSDTGRYKVPIGPSQLPRMLEIVTRSADSAPSARRRELHRPTLLADDKPIPVEVSLWSIGWSKSVAPRIEGARTVAAADHAALRLDRWVGIAEAATSSALESPPPDGYHWFRRWAAWLTALRQEAFDAISESDSRRPVSQVSSDSQEQLSEAGKRLDEWIDECSQVLAWPDLELSLESLAPSKSFFNGRRFQLEVDQWIYCVAEGGPQRLTMNLSATQATATQIRLLGLLAIVSLAAACVWLMRRPAARDWLYRWPHAVGFLLGVGYWAWLWPSWLGILIAAGSLFLAARLGWAGRSLRVDGSTVLIVGRPA